MGFGFSGTHDSVVGEMCCFCVNQAVGTRTERPSAVENPTKGFELHRCRDSALPDSQPFGGEARPVWSVPPSLNFSGGISPGFTGVARDFVRGGESVVAVVWPLAPGAPRVDFPLPCLDVERDCSASEDVVLERVSRLLQCALVLLPVGARESPCPTWESA